MHSYTKHPSHSLNDPSLDPVKQHTAWLDNIRSTCWVYAGSPADEVPSSDALYPHWKQSVWVINTWHQALRKTPELLPITDYGWEHSNEGLKNIWDCTNNINKVEQRLDFYTKGCKCSKGDTLCNPQKGALIIIDSVVQHANAQRKSAATRASHLVKHLYKWCLHIVHTSIRVLLCPTSFQC